MTYEYTNPKGVTYYLNSKQVVLRKSKRQLIFYFTREERPEAVSELPPGMEVNENPRTGLLILKRK